MLFKQKFKVYPFKSDMPLYKWKVTSKYAYCPFKAKTFCFDSDKLHRPNSISITF